MTTNEKIGELIRERRRKVGMSMPDLGDILGVSEQMVQKYETGASPITAEKLMVVAKALKCTVGRLIPS